MRLIVAARVEDQLPDQLAVLGDHPHAKAIDERQHRGAGETSAEADVCSRELWRSVITPVMSTLSRRTRTCEDIGTPGSEGAAFGRARNASDGVRRSIARCGLTSL